MIYEKLVKIAKQIKTTSILRVFRFNNFIKLVKIGLLLGPWTGLWPTPEIGKECDATAIDKIDIERIPRKKETYK